MQSTDASITVCIVTHGRPQMLARLLDRLATCRIPPAYQGALIVENGGCNDSRTIVERAADQLAARYLVCDSKLKSSALNLALRQPADGLMLFIDDDALPDVEWLSAYHNAYLQYGPGHYFGGPIVADHDKPPPEWLRRFLPESAVGFDASSIAEPHRSSLHFLGFNWAADVSDLKACGGFSEDFGPGTDLGGGDETFMQFQLQQAGIKSVYVPEALVRHYVPESRCSPKWGLRRTFLGGICHGINYEHDRRMRRLPIRRVRATARFLRRRSRRQDLVRLILLHPAGRYWLRHCWAAGSGFWQGIARGAREKPLSNVRWVSRGLGTQSGDALARITST